MLLGHDPNKKPPLRDPPSCWPAMVLVQQLGGPQLPLRGLTEGLATSLVTQFGDDVQVIVVDPIGTDLPASVGWHRRVVRVPIEDPEAASSLVFDMVRRTWPAYAYTFIDASAMNAEFTKQLVVKAPEANLGEDLWLRLVRVGDPKAVDAAPEAEDWRTLRTRFLDGAPPEPASGCQLVKDMLPRKDRLGGNPNVVRYPNPVNPTTDIRVRMHIEGHVPVGSFDLWARGVSDRRVGLALGGSGAWGFAHAALIDRLARSQADVTEADVQAAFEIPDLRPEDDVRMPIDMITSASSGSVIGAYYAVLGNDGIPKVLDAGWRLQIAVPFALITMLSLELVVARDLGFVNLHDVELMFLPVCTNLTQGRAEYAKSGSLPWAVRASGSFPGLFASTIAGDSVYCDGAISDNVPATLVDALGAGLVIAANPLPPPQHMKIRPPRTAIGRFFRELNPILRVRELATGVTLMLHDTGDWEAQMYLCYDPPPNALSMGGTFAFAMSHEIYKAVLSEPEFKRTIRNAKLTWKRLSSARQGIVGLEQLERGSVA